MHVSQEDHDRIARAIEAAEATSSGEIVCVLAHSSGDYSQIAIIWAAVGSLALPWLLMWRTQWTLVHILLAQVLLFAALWLLFSLPAINIRLVPRHIQRLAAHRSAMEQFMVRHVSRASQRCGILIFVSLTERYARIVADDGVAAKIPQSEWQSIVDRLTTDLAAARIADGFAGAIASCGAVLARHFPPSPGQRNQLPDRLYVI